MARTAGSTSNLVVKFPTLVKAIGMNYQGNITVNRNWFTQTAETNGFRVQVFPAGKKTVAKSKPVKAAKKAKTAKPNKAKPKPAKKVRKAKAAKPDQSKVIKFQGAEFKVTPVPATIPSAE